MRLPQHDLPLDNIKYPKREGMEEYSAEETVITAVSENDDQSVETTVIMEEHIIVDQTETVNQPTLQQYSKYHIDMSQTFDFRASTGTLYNEEGA
jgi:hypothetical protein